MRYRRFPRIPGVDISVLGFGCMRLPVIGGDPVKIDHGAAVLLLHRAIQAGVNYVDTAYPYHGGQSEAFLGTALAGGYRERVHLATKLPVWLVRERGDWERLLTEQLQRLHTDHVDFYLLHALSTERWKTVESLGGLAAMERFKADGRIRHIGFSFHDSAPAFRPILEGYDWEFCQIQYNFMDEAYQAGAEGLALAAARGVGVIAMEPLRGGGLAANIPPAVEEIWTRSPMRMSPAQRALGWVWNHPGIITALSGMNAPAQLAENLAAAEAAAPASLTEADLALFSQVRDYYRARTPAACTACGYCMPCPHGVAIPDVLSMYIGGVMYQSKAGAGWYRAQMLKTGRGGDSCTRCGECEPKCPQSVPIMDKLAEAHAFLTTP
jgi:uncharacterized protein